MRFARTAAGAGVALALAALIAACGSTRTRTVTVTHTVAAASTQSQTASRTSTTRTRTTTTTTSSAASTTTAASSSSAGTTTTATSTTLTTRTETAPAFVGTNPQSPRALGRALRAAVALLERHGYTPVSTATYHSHDTLRVLIGRGADGLERAFFFDQAIYLGTDASAASAHISVRSHSDTEVELAYAIYAAGASAPSGERTVRFALDMGQLSPLGPLPSAAARR